MKMPISGNEERRLDVFMGRLGSNSIHSQTLTGGEMGRIVIDELDDAMMDGLAILAAANRTSIGEQAKALLAQSLSRPSRADLVRRAEAIAAMTPGAVLQTDSVLLLRRDRDR